MCPTLDCHARSARLTLRGAYPNSSQVSDLEYLVQYVDPLVGESDDEGGSGTGSESEGDEELRTAEANTEGKAGEESGRKRAKSQASKAAPGEASSMTPQDEQRLRDARRGLRRLSTAVCELVSEYSLVAFQALSVTDKYAMHALLTSCDKSNGYIFATQDLKNVDPRYFVMKATDPELDPEAKVVERAAQPGHGAPGPAGGASVASAVPAARPLRAQAAGRASSTASPAGSRAGQRGAG